MRKTNVRTHARRTKRGVTTVHKHPRQLKNLSYSQIQKTKGIRLSKKGDADGDGVPNAKDCKPLNPKKQGFLHDLRMKQLKRQEEAVEARREKEQKKLNDVQDELRLKKSISEKKLSIKRKEMAEKQSLIDEQLREKKELRAIREKNRLAKIELEKYTFTGKLKRGAASVGRASVKAIVAADRALEKSGRKSRKTTKRITTKRKTAVSKPRSSKPRKRKSGGMLGGF